MNHLPNFWKSSDRINNTEVIMKKSIRFASLVLLTVLIISACVNRNGPVLPDNEANDDKIVLHIMHTKQEAPETYHKLAEAFHQKHPDITIKYEVPTNYDLELQKRMNRGETPDIYSAGATQANAGLLMDLSGQEFLSNVRTVHYDTVTRQGEYFFPVGYSGAGIICNENLLNSYGLNLPETLEDLEKIYGTLSKENLYTFALGFKDLWATHYCFRPAYYAVYARHPAWNRLKSEGKTSFASTPEWKTTADVIKKYVYAFGNTDTAFERGYMDSCNMLAQNRAALLVQGSWAAAVIEDYNSNVSLRMVPLPISNNPEEGMINFYCDYSLSISADTEHPEEALLYLEFLASEEAAKIYVENSGSFSSVIGAPIPDNQISEDIQSYVNSGRYIDNPTDGWPPYFFEDAERLLAEYIFDGINYEDMVYNLDVAWERIEKENL